MKRLYSILTILVLFSACKKSTEPSNTIPPKSKNNTEVVDKFKLPFADSGTSSTIAKNDSLVQYTPDFLENFNPLTLPIVIDSALMFDVRENRSITLMSHFMIHPNISFLEIAANKYDLNNEFGDFSNLDFDFVSAVLQGTEWNYSYLWKVTLPSNKTGIFFLKSYDGDDRSMQVRYNVLDNTTGGILSSKQIAKYDYSRGGHPGEEHYTEAQIDKDFNVSKIKHF